MNSLNSRFGCSACSGFVAVPRSDFDWETERNCFCSSEWCGHCCYSWHIVGLFATALAFQPAHWVLACLNSSVACLIYAATEQAYQPAQGASHGFLVDAPCSGREQRSSYLHPSGTAVAENIDRVSIIGGYSDFDFGWTTWLVLHLCSSPRLWRCCWCCPSCCLRWYCCFGYWWMRLV